MNYDDFNLIYKYEKEHIYPNIQCIWNKVSSPEASMDGYLLAIGDDPHRYKYLSIPYFMKPDDFLKKYKDNCIIFSSPSNPQEGTMAFIHQINPRVHLFSRLYCFIDKNKVHGYIVSGCLYKDYNEAIKFIDQSFDLAQTGSTDETPRPGF